MIPRQPHYVVLLLSEKRLSIDKKMLVKLFSLTPFVSTSK